MYEYIKGKLIEKNPTYLIVESGGVGYHINISLNTYGKFADASELCKVFTWLQVKEDSHTLYGFADEDERRLFLNLISVSGIGANTARMMLSSMSTDDIQQAIMRGDVPSIQRIKGIGAKTAQRLVLELQDKLKKEGLLSLSQAPLRSTIQEEALSALVMLGFVKHQAEKVIQKILHENSGAELTVELLIKQALKNL